MYTTIVGGAIFIYGDLDSSMCKPLAVTWQFVRSTKNAWSPAPLYLEVTTIQPESNSQTSRPPTTMARTVLIS